MVIPYPVCVTIFLNAYGLILYQQSTYIYTHSMSALNMHLHNLVQLVCMHVYIHAHICVNVHIHTHTHTRGIT